MDGGEKYETEMFDEVYEETISCSFNKITIKIFVSGFEVARGHKIERDIYLNDLLGARAQPPNVGKEMEVIPVKSRRNDFTYRSPLEEDRDSPIVDSSKRFGNPRSYNNRHGYDSSSSNTNARSTENSAAGKNAFFSCYTNRYNNEKGCSDSRTKSDRNKRSDGSPLSWRKKEEKSGGDNSSRRNRNNDKSGCERKRHEERSKSRDDKKKYNKSK